jgi:hypothetical protein
MTGAGGNMDIREEIIKLEAAKREVLSELENTHQSAPADWEKALDAFVKATADRAEEKLTLHHLTMLGFNTGNNMGLDRLTAWELLCLVDQKKARNFLLAAGKKHLPADVVLLTEDERNESAARLNKAILGIDRELASLLDRAAAAGLHVELETLPHPLAILGLRDVSEIDWTFYSPRLEGMEAEAEAANSVAQARRQNVTDAMAGLANLERQAGEHSKPPSELQREVATAKDRLQRAQEAHRAALEEASRKRRLPSAVRHYLEANRRPRPLSNIDHETEVQENG